MLAFLSRPPLLPGHRPRFSLGPVGPRPGTPGRAPALRARGLPAPRLAPAGEMSVAAKHRAEALGLPLQSLKSSSNSPKGFRDNTFCNWHQREVKFYVPAVELRAHWNTCRQSFQSLHLQLWSRPAVFYINKSYIWQNIVFLSKSLRVYTGLLSNYNLL